jgi:hypothetical protein
MEKSMNKFKIGDSVQCVNNARAEDILTVGDVYVVKHINDNTDLISFDDPEQLWYDWRFDLVEESIAPEKFNFFHVLEPARIFTATKYDNSHYVITLENVRLSGRSKYTIETVNKYIKNCEWQIVETVVEQKFNGTDINGEAINFTAKDLKPLQRFKTRNGDMHVVVANSQKDLDSFDNLIGVSKDGWMPFDPTNNEIDAYKAIAVYDVPFLNRDLLDPTIFGELIWQLNGEKSELEIPKKNV